jgi:hypothetical protein
MSVRSRFLCALGLAGWAVGRAMARYAFFRRDVLPGLMISAAVLGVVFVAAELYFRAGRMFPTSQNHFVGRWIDQVGFTFIPGDTIKWTNGLDFWASTEVNSLGFLDREPVLPKPAGTFRILVVGDSFVEAAQVPIAKKLQTLLAAELKDKFPGRDIDAIAIGYSGTGQSNQLPYYERSRRDLKPDLVILVFVGNDFANNSNVLESIRYGWHPDHLPRLFMRASTDGSCERLPIDPNWTKFLIPGDVVSREKHFRAMSPDIDRALSGWTAADNLDRMFYRSSLPPAFEAAVASTKCAFAEWKKLAVQDGFKLLVVSDAAVAGTGAGQIDRLNRIMRDLDLPLIDLLPEFKKHPQPALAHYRDGHWSPSGHRWAAEAIVRYLVDQGVIAKS